jgi:hypothetical protein
VHAAAAAAGAATRPAEQLREQLARRHPLRQGVPVAAMRAERHVLPAEMVAHGGGDRLLPDIRVAGAQHQAPLMTAGQLLLRLSDELHRAVQAEQHVARRRRARLPLAEARWRFGGRGLHDLDSSEVCSIAGLPTTLAV